MSKYIAYNYGKANQSFIMKDENGNAVFEANLVKFNLLKAHDYEFVDSTTGRVEPHKVGQTITKEGGIGSLNFTTASYFKFDGENCFDYLDSKGYYFKLIAKLDILHPEFGLMDKNGNKVASFKTNVLGDRQEGVVGIGNKQRNTVVETESDDLESIFFAAFILSRVNFSTTLL